ncbi:MAG: GIY-YIG nuclease family protein [Bacteroidetes bacterium]|nr:GIY-YIG nuclease family protein [Bacteroidota bacterium]
MFFTYILRSVEHKRFYVGMSSDVDQRLKQHNAGRTKSTKPYGPWELIHVEEFETRLEARKRELYLKSGFGREWIKRKWPRSSIE